MMDTEKAVEQAFTVMSKALFGGTVDPKDLTYDMLDTLANAALKWSYVETAMKPRNKEQIREGYFWVRTKWGTHWQPAEIHKEMGRMAMTAISAFEFIDDDFFNDWVIGPEIVEPPVGAGVK